MGQEKFCLKWNDFQSTVSRSFGLLRKEEDFFDVTLVSDDDSQLHAHKLVLSACSSFFKTILKKHTHSHPLIYLNGINCSNLGFILDYIYHGEVQIYQEELDNFLNVAQKLKIQGLISDNKVHDAGAKAKEEEEDSKSFTDVEEDSLIPTFAKPPRHKPNVPSSFKKEVARIDLSGTSNLEEVDQKIEELTDRINGVWTCKACGKTSQRKRDLGWHIETHLEGLSFSCSDCDKTFRSRSVLDHHKRRTCKKSFF